MNRAPSRRLGISDRERGALGGLEALPFGFLLFVVGLLFVVNIWAVIDARLAVGAAAREGARRSVEAPDAPTAVGAASETVRATLRAHGRDRLERTTVETSLDRPFGRCARVTVTVRYEVPVISLPWIRGLGHGIDAVATHSEVVDPYRHGLAAGGCG